jgi:hypothetical protein
VEAIPLRRDADDNGRVAAQLSVENSHRFDALNQATVAAVYGDNGAVALGTSSLDPFTTIGSLHRCLHMVY